MKECVGFWGRTFGHNFQPRYTKRVSPPDPGRVEDSLLAVFLPDVIHAGTRHEVTYECDVCRRCGEVINKQKGNNDDSGQ